MNLNKTMRQAIVRMVMDDTSRTADTMAEALRAKVVGLVESKTPAKVLALWRDEELRGWVQTCYVTTCVGSVEVPSDRDRSWVFWEKVIRSELADDIKAFKAEQARREGVRQSLTTQLASCRTVKQFTARFPELAKYAPKAEARVANLPVCANLMKSLVELGWPDGGKVGAEAGTAVEVTQ